MRLAIYSGVSSLLAIGVVLNAMHQRSNFYAACLYLAKSSACIMILLNMGLILAICFGKALQALFFGTLRAIEVEHLYERSWYAVSETCLAMTIFREEFNLQFVIVFTTLLFLKIFHWLCQDRVEFMEQSPSHRVSFHVRMINLMALLLIVDCVLAQHAINVTMRKGPNMMIMFGFEYTILIWTMLSTMGKYIINVVDMRSEEPWEGKSMCVFYLDLFTDFFKLITYIVFFIFICYYYQLPLHIIRDVYVTLRSFIQKCRDLYRYRRATRNMNELYPNAAAEDFTRNDSTCIICREEMHVMDDNNNEDRESPSPRERQQQNMDQPKKLPCGHIFHFHCLRSWLERQQSCPTCRRSVLPEGNNGSSREEERAPQQQQNGGAGGAGVPHANQQQPNAPSPQQPPPQPNQFGSFYGHDNMPPLQQQQHTTQAPGLGILTPDPAWASSSTATPNNAYPGMIPLIPLSGPSAQVSSTAAADPVSLSDEQIQALSNTTRDAMVQRLRLLETVQNQIFHSMQVLTQALSVVPDNTAAVNTNTSTETAPSSSTTAQAERPSTSNPSDDIRSSPSMPSSSSSSSDIKDENQADGECTKERKGKMPETRRGSQSSPYCIDSDSNSNED
ncbi:zinc finger protein [Lichtheimia corymbifera JMRC:FSU:9682]|uniref:RING-type E3 ubiquitin transferase n=1 Tax=Lichtheimia corymbifera JMRC:FSU:9682 TaxID=1263082 RepID=A0A068S4M4_9FUNG|nr:zinc finger protein [Lichtheimia corymbifera JMRC:FSU:9682]